VTSLFASFLQKISAATDRLRQIALNRKLSPKFEEWRKVSIRVEEKWHTKRNLVKRDRPLRNTCCFPLQKGYENSPKCYVIRTLQFFSSYICLRLQENLYKSALTADSAHPAVYLVCFELRTQKVKFFAVQKAYREETTWKTQAQMGGKY